MIKDFNNIAINDGIENYIYSVNNKEGIKYNSFLTVVIRSLISIYGENNIIVPYENKSLSLLTTSLKKYKYSPMKLEKFLKDMEEYYILEKNKVIPNTKFMDIQKALVDMYMCKKLIEDISLESKEEFLGLLYSPKSTNVLMISHNYMHNKDTLSVMNYFIEQEKINIRINVSDPKVLLSPEAYRVINKSYTDVCLLSASDVKKINETVYKKLSVNKSDPNFEHLYDKALFNHYQDTTKMSSGNGYVDILLVMGIICTISLVGLVVYLLVR